MNLNWISFPNNNSNVFCVVYRQAVICIKEIERKMIVRRKMHSCQLTLSCVDSSPVCVSLVITFQRCDERGGRVFNGNAKRPQKRLQMLSHQFKQPSFVMI